MFAEVTTTQVGVWVGCAAVILGFIGALMVIGNQLEKKFVSRERYDALDERVKLLESDRRTVADEARAAKHDDLMRALIEAIAKNRK